MTASTDIHDLDTDPGGAHHQSALHSRQGQSHEWASDISDKLSVTSDDEGL